MTKLVKAVPLKDRAIEHGLLIRKKKLRSDDKFMEDMDKLVDSILFLAIKYQDNTYKKTLTSSAWMKKTIDKVDSMKRELNETKLYLEEK